MNKVYVSAIEFLRMCERGEIPWPFSHAVGFIKACRDSGAKEWRISEPDRGRYIVIQIPDYPVWVDNTDGAMP